MGKRYYFVYNAKSGLLSALKDTFHKALAPDSYECNLCKITYGTVSMKEQWRRFVYGLGKDVEFLHKDEFESKFKKGEYPSVYVEENGKLSLIVSRKEMNSVKDLSELIDLMKKKIK